MADFEIPNVIPTALRQWFKAGFFLLRAKSAVSSLSRSIAFSALDERDRQGQLGHVPKPLPGIAPR